MQGKLNDTLISVQEYLNDDYVDTTGKSLIIDWYYKKTVSGMSRRCAGYETVLHYCKICNGTVLYASENDPKWLTVGINMDSIRLCSISCSRLSTVLSALDIWI